MDIENLIGKKVKVEIIGKTSDNKYYIGNSKKEGYKIYIKDTNDYDIQELVGKIKECIIIDIRQRKLIGFILDDRKFVNDIRKIENKLKSTKEYENIKDIYLMERLKINGKVLGLYLVDEGDIGKYYLDTLEIGTFSKKIRQNNILFKERKIEEELGKQIRDVVMSIDLAKKEISLREEKEKQKHLIEKALGIEAEYEITKIATISLKQKILEEKKRKTKNENQKINKTINIQKNLAKIKDVNIKQEMKMSSKVSDMKTLEQILKDDKKLPQIRNKKFIKMGIIESDHTDNLLDIKTGQKARVNTTRYSFVAIATDGTVVPLDLKQDHQEGNNPNEINYQVNQKGEVEQDDVTSRFKIGNGTFAIKNGEYGEIKVYHSPRKTIGGNGVEGNKSLDRQLETDNVWIMKKEVRDLAAKYKTGYRSVEEGYQEAKMHENEKGEIIEKDNMRVEDIDGIENTKSHIHDNVDYENLAVKLGYYKEGKPNLEKAKQLYEQKRKENPKAKQKEIIEMLTEELEEQIGHAGESR